MNQTPKKHKKDVKNGDKNGAWPHFLNDESNPYAM